MLWTAVQQKGFRRPEIRKLQPSPQTAETRAARSGRWTCVTLTSLSSIMTCSLQLSVESQNFPKHVAERLEDLFCVLPRQTL